MTTEQILLQTLLDKNLSLAAAESCTGGLICQRLTSISGASAAVLGGVVSYAVSVKENVLGVSAETIEKYGVVSERCAAEMARGVKRITGADTAVSVTGLAGPGGGTPETPVGTVCFGITAPMGERTYTMHFPEELGRDGIRGAAADFAMRALQDMLSSPEVADHA